MILYGTEGEKLTLHYDQAGAADTLYAALRGRGNNLERRYRDTQSHYIAQGTEAVYGAKRPAPDCGGHRPKKARRPCDGRRR